MSSRVSCTPDRKDHALSFPSSSAIDRSPRFFRFATVVPFPLPPCPAKAHRQPYDLVFVVWAASNRLPILNPTLLSHHLPDVRFLNLRRSRMPTFSTGTSFNTSKDVVAARVTIMRVVVEGRKGLESLRRPGARGRISMVSLARDIRICIKQLVLTSLPSTAGFQ